jgi:hypothetical protein
MQIPQLPGKFMYELFILQSFTFDMVLGRYHPGHICLFYLADIFHQVVLWTPDPMQCQDELTPGRIGLVFFFKRRAWSCFATNQRGGADTLGMVLGSSFLTRTSRQFLSFVHFILTLFLSI